MVLAHHSCEAYACFLKRACVRQQTSPRLNTNEPAFKSKRACVCLQKQLFFVASGKYKRKVDVLRYIHLLCFYVIVYTVFSVYITRLISDSNSPYHYCFL